MELFGWREAVYHKGLILSAVLFFFLVVQVLITFFRKGLSPSRVGATIRIGILGLLLLLLEWRLRGVPDYGPFVSRIQGLIVLLCLANFVAYLLVDVYFFFRMKKEVPAFLRELLVLGVYVVFGMAALRYVFRVDVSSILTTTTVLTAAVALAMQTTIANVVSGFYVQHDKGLRRGTWIALREKDVSGEIVNVGLRYTTLRTLDNQQILVPNNQLMQNAVVRLDAGRGDGASEINMKVDLGYEHPPEDARALLLRALAEDEEVLPDPAPIVRMARFLDSGVEYNLKYWLADYRRTLVVRDRVLNRIWYSVTRAGRTFPYPHREIVAKSPAQPFRLPEQETLARLRTAAVLRTLGEDELRILAGRVRPVVFGAGESVVRQGDEGDSLFIVTRGELSVQVDGTPAGELREGDVFGEMSLLTGELRRATVVARGEVHLVEITKGEIEPIIRANPSLAGRLSGILAEREDRLAALRRPGEPAPPGVTAGDLFVARLKSFFGLNS